MAGRASARRVRALGGALVLALLFPPGLAADGAGAVPQRVVSVNLCTDQLALMLASDGQLVSVGQYAGDPDMSVMAAAAAFYPENHASAEEVFLLRPDLVLAGSFTSRDTVALLRRLGFRVEEFAPARSFDEIRAHIRRMGDLLGVPARAEALVARFDASMPPVSAPTGLEAAVVSANDYLAGAGTLDDEILAAAGIGNVAGGQGRRGMAPLPLERLVLARPDLLVEDVPAGSDGWRAYGRFSHPAYRALAAGAERVTLPTRLRVCGTPAVADAVRFLDAIME